MAAVRLTDLSRRLLLTPLPSARAAKGRNRWCEALVEARHVLQIKGWQEIGGATPQGQQLLAVARAILRRQWKKVKRWADHWAAGVSYFPFLIWVIVMAEAQAVDCVAAILSLSRNWPQDVELVWSFAHDHSKSWLGKFAKSCLHEFWKSETE